MTRSRATAKQAGSTFERQTADYLAEHIDDRIDRRPKTGSKDKGDIGGLRTSNGERVTVECKNTAKTSLGTWATEAETERLNDTDRNGTPALATIIIHKRHGKGQPAEQWVTMTLRDLTAIINQERPNE